MATPVGHGLAALAIFSFVAASAPPKHRLTVCVLCIFTAVAPDLDFLPGLAVGQPAYFHQGPSHSLLFAFVVGFSLANLFRVSGIRRTTLFAAYFTSYTTHLVIDFFGPDGRAPFGIPLFWPVSTDYFLSPFAVFRGVRHAETTSDTTREWVANIVQWYNVGSISLEILIVLPFVISAFWISRTRDTLGGRS